MSRKKLQSIVNYEIVSENYLRRRQLKVGVGSLFLWGLGVGAVISGDFYGWNYGLIAGGFWGLAIATFLMAIMYICMVYSLAELSVALPHAGGFYSFTRNAFGPFWGYICGVAVTIEYVFATAAIIYSMSNYLKPLIDHFFPLPSYLIWLILYAIFVRICIQGMELSLYVSFWLTLVAIMVLGIFYVSMLAAGVFKPELLFNVPADPGQSATWLPKGWLGVFAAIPYAIWFYLAIEVLPVASEETQDVPKNMPTGLITAMFTLVVLSILTLVLNSGIGDGAVAIGQSSVPLSEGLEAYFGKGATNNTITAIALSLGLGVSLLTLIYSYGRILFALSRTGYIPRWISVTKNNTPYRALILGTVIGFVCVILVDAGSDAVDAVILNMSVLAALISYILVMLSYIKLKFSRAELKRPYESPLGIPGALIGTTLAIFALIACLSVPTYQVGIWGVITVIILATLYFFFSRNRLVAQAPEEAAALKK
ncbi:amino acid permease [Fischerella sp. JS2]|uniref:amino acid permease n=1 Tax=Fischerella sp. JS2 TaxID=2597771 RepID=UPI0028E981C4|nr:amino acid permease [Fischerella sp. JS2]